MVSMPSIVYELWNIGTVWGQLPRRNACIWKYINQYNQTDILMKLPKLLALQLCKFRQNDDIYASVHIHVLLDDAFVRGSLDWQVELIWKLSQHDSATKRGLHHMYISRSHAR